MELSSLKIGSLSLTDLIHWHSLSILQFSNKDKKALLKLLSENMVSGNYILALNTCCLALLTDKESAMGTIKAKGLFRYSKFLGKKCYIADIAKELINVVGKAAGLTCSEIRYLRSVIHLEYIYKHSCDSYQFIIETISTFHAHYKGGLLKTLVAYAELAFFNNHEIENRECQSIEGRTKEEIAYACSYITHILSEQNHLTLGDALFISTDFMESDLIDQLILNACFIDDFKEMEIKIESLGYYLELGDSKSTLYPPLPNFEKVMRLGYIRNDLQRLTNTLDLTQEDFFKEALSIEKFATYLVEKSDFPICDIRRQVTTVDMSLLCPTLQ